MDDFTVIGKIVVDSSGASIQGLNNDLAATAETSSGLSGIFSRLGDVATFAIGGLITHAVEMATGAITGFISSIGEVTSKMEDSQAQLQSALKNTGDVTGVTSEMVDELSQSFANTTKFSGQSAVAAAAVIAQFSNIGKDVFPQAMQASADLATKMGTDLPSAASTVAKALADPVMGIGRLNQAYKLFEPEQLKAVENMAKMGNVAQAQQMILDALNQKIGGAAAAAADTFSGKMAILNNKMDTVKETIGNLVLPILSKFLDIFLKTGALEAFQKLILDIGAGIQRFFTPIMAVFSAWWTTYGPAIELQIKRLQLQFQGFIANITPDMQKFIQDALGKFGAWFMENGPEIVKFISQIADAIIQMLPVIEKIIEIAAPVFLALLEFFLEAIQGLMELSTAWDDNWNKIKESTTAALAPIVSVIVGIVAVIMTISKAAAAMVALVSQKLSEMAEYFSDMASKIVGMVTGIGQSLYDAGVNLVMGLWNGITSAWRNMLAMFQTLVEQLPDAIKQILGIHSPSIVFSGIGENISAGLAHGISRGMNLPIAALTTGATRMVAATNAVGGSYYHGGTNTTTRNQHYGAVNNIYVGHQPSPSDIQKLTRRPGF